MIRACNIIKKFGGGGNCARFAYTLAEVVIVMLVVAVIVAVSVKITKAKLDNIVSYTYYSGYSTLKDITKQILNDFKTTDEYINSDLSWFHIFFAPAMAKDCVVEGLWGDGKTKSCGNYNIVNACTIKNWNCRAHIGQYGITEEMCNIGLAVPYGRVLTNGHLDGAYGDGVVSKILNYLEKSGELAGKDASYIADAGNTYNSVCSTYWDSTGSWSGLNACHDTDMSWECEQGMYAVIISNETIEADDTCENQPSATEIETKRCLEGKEWQGYPTCAYKQITCDQTGYHWSTTQCGCVPEPTTLPRKGENFCKKFVSYANTKSGSTECSGSKIDDDLTNFAGKIPDITLRNGMKLYNVRQNPKEILPLAGNTQGSSYDGVSNVNTFGYTVYLDIDGTSGTSTLWEDVYPFYITMSGKVIPAYDMTAGADEVGGNSRRHLMTSVERETVQNGSRQLTWVKKSVSFKEAACSSGYVGDGTAYCHDVSLNRNCTDDTNICILKFISPVKFFK